MIRLQLVDRYQTTLCNLNHKLLFIQQRQRNDYVSVHHNARNHLLTRSITPPIEAATL